MARIDAIFLDGLDLLRDPCTGVRVEGAGVGQPVDPSLKNLGGWLERMKARPSAEA